MSNTKNPTFWSTLNIWDWITFALLGGSTILCAVLTICLHSKWTTPAIVITGGVVPAAFIAGFIFVAWSRWQRYQDMLKGIKTPKFELTYHTSPNTASWILPTDIDRWIEETVSMLILAPNRAIVADLITNSARLAKWTYTDIVALAKQVVVRCYDQKYLEYNDGAGNIAKASALTYGSQIAIATEPKTLTGKCTKVLCYERIKSLFCHEFTHVVYFTYDIGPTAATAHALMKQMNLPF